jgi:hypothetical protein
VKSSAIDGRRGTVKRAKARQEDMPGFDESSFLAGLPWNNHPELFSLQRMGVNRE